MIRLILAQLPIDIVGGEQRVGGGSWEGSGDTDMVDDVRREMRKKRERALPEMELAWREKSAGRLMEALR